MIICGGIFTLQTTDVADSHGIKITDLHSYSRLLEVCRFFWSCLSSRKSCIPSTHKLSLTHVEIYWTLLNSNGELFDAAFIGNSCFSSQSVNLSFLSEAFCLAGHLVLLMNTFLYPVSSCHGLVGNFLIFTSCIVQPN